MFIKVIAPIIRMPRSFVYYARMQQHVGPGTTSSTQDTMKGRLDPRASLEYLDEELKPQHASFMEKPSSFMEDHSFSSQDEYARED
uniref:Uncharacterized protein n=1 Tax=Acrobeloides nanus TaxID=290746 RepID=A0A914E345_9BILA